VAARKLRIKDIIMGRLESDNGSRNTLITNLGESNEIRVCGTIVNTFVSDDENYGNLILDDGSESIQIKFWRNDVNTVKKYNVGDFSDVIAGVREYNDERYLQPIQLFKGDIHKWIRFQLQVALDIKKLIDSASWGALPHNESKDEIMELDDFSSDEDFSNVGNEDSFEEDSIIFDDDDINKAVIEALGSEPMTKEEIIKKTMLDEIDVMLSIKELMESGDLFEVDGKYKKP